MELLRGEAGHLIIAAFVGWATVMIRRVLIRTLALDERIEHNLERIQDNFEHLLELEERVGSLAVKLEREPEPPLP